MLGRSVCPSTARPYIPPHQSHENPRPSPFRRCCAGCKDLCSSTALCEAYDYELKGEANNPCNLYGAEIKADTPGMGGGSDWTGGTAMNGNTAVIKGSSGTSSYKYRCSVKDKPQPGGGESVGWFALPWPVLAGIKSTGMNRGSFAARFWAPRISGPARCLTLRCCSLFVSLGSISHWPAHAVP